MKKRSSKMKIDTKFTNTHVYFRDLKKKSKSLMHENSFACDVGI